MELTGCANDSSASLDTTTSYCVLSHVNILDSQDCEIESEALMEPENRRKLPGLQFISANNQMFPKEEAQSASSHCLTASCRLFVSRF